MTESTRALDETALDTVHAGTPFKTAFSLIRTFHGDDFVLYALKGGVVFKKNKQLHVVSADFVVGKGDGVVGIIDRDNASVTGIPGVLRVYVFEIPGPARDFTLDFRRGAFPEGGR